MVLTHHKPLKESLTPVYTYVPTYYVTHIRDYDYGEFMEEREMRPHIAEPNPTERTGNALFRVERRS